MHLLKHSEPIVSHYNFVVRFIQKDPQCWKTDFAFLT